jgi:hypothetical protein
MTCSGLQVVSSGFRRRSFLEDLCLGEVGWEDRGGLSIPEKEERLKERLCEVIVSPEVRKGGRFRHPLEPGEEEGDG